MDDINKPNLDTKRKKFFRDNYNIRRDFAKEFDSSMFKCFLWALQILTWIFFLVFIILLLCDISAFAMFLAFFLVAYGAYIVLELRSSTAKMLRNINSIEGINEKMRKYFSTPPKIELKCEVYIEYEVPMSFTNNNGITYTRYVKQRELVRIITLDFPYYSAKDVSGLFSLDNKAAAENKSFIKLELIEEVEFADTISYMDYFFEKNVFYEINGGLKSNDNNVFSESRAIEGMNNQNLIKIDDSTSLIINFPFFVISTILMFAELYKPCLKYFWYEQKFKVRKIISTRYDLNQPDIDTKYQYISPKIYLHSQIVNLQPQEYNYLNNECPVEQPTKEELEMSKVFQDVIPVYRILNNGVILDDNTQNNNNNNESYNNNIGTNEENNKRDIDLPLIQTQ